MSCILLTCEGNPGFNAQGFGITHLTAIGVNPGAWMVMIPRFLDGWVMWES